jgi:hypothetical protein
MFHGKENIPYTFLATFLPVNPNRIDREINDPL